MARLTIAGRVLEELRRSSRPLDDDERADRLGVRPRQTINQVCRRLERSGHLRRYAGPEGKIVNDVRRSSSAQPPLIVPVTAAPGGDTGRPDAADGVSPGSGPAWPGHPVTATDLYQAGFRPLGLRVTSLDVNLPSDRGCEWTTIGEVPDALGLYASPWKTITRSGSPTSGSPSTCGWSPGEGCRAAAAHAAASATDGHDMQA